MVASLPDNLIESIPPPLRPDARAWWESLGESERDELALLCDSRREIFLFETFSEDDSPAVTGGRFIPHDDAFGIDDWGEDYFQHLLDHPELVIAFDPASRTFHLGCSRHVDARRCFAKGEIRHPFNCPFGSRECLMHQILGDRTSVSLRPLR